VKLTLGKEMTPDLVKKEKPDIVVIALGADPVLPEKIPGTKGSNIVSAADVMSGRAKAGNRVAIWTCSYHCTFTCGQKIAPVKGDLTGINSMVSYACQAGYAAVDTAEYLASQGKLVSIVTERDAVVPGMGYTSRGYLIRRFYRANIRVCSNVKVKELNERGLVLEKAGITFLLDADTVIISVGARQRKDLVEALKGEVSELHAVGDGQKIGNAMTSIESAYDAAMEI
jgi:2,4-dienoyl-CoA reductase (NADPH2)